MEVVDCDNMHVNAVPCKQLDGAALRHARSQDDLTSSSSSSPACASSAERSPHTEPVTASTGALGSVMGWEFDEADCWSQEDDDIIQVTVDIYTCMRQTPLQCNNVHCMKIEPDVMVNCG